MSLRALALRSRHARLGRRTAQLDTSAPQVVHQLGQIVATELADVRHLDSRAMAALAEQRLADVLDAVAAATPAPGGGSSAGIACALAAALVEMAAGIGDAAGVDSARSLRARALELAERELSSYAPVLEARRLRSYDPAKPDRIAAALEEASAVPLEIRAVAADVAALARRVGAEVSVAVSADAETGRLLAEAAAASAALLVDTNRREA
jgi:methenyltetrahydrofolate cyclohydrolase